MSDGAPEAMKPLLPAGAGPYERHVFVCISGGTCPTQGAEAIHAAMKDLAKRVCGQVAVRVNKSGCLGQCGHGPMIAVYPENVWYAGVRLEDVPELVERHLVRGEIVERLLFRGHHAGPNVHREGVIRDPSAAAVVARVLDAARRRFGDRYRSAYLWGSHARGDAIETSDIDVGVFVRGAMPAEECLRHEEEIQAESGADDRLDFAIVPDANLDDRDAVSFRCGAVRLDGEDLAAAVPLPTHEEWADLSAEATLRVVVRRRASPVSAPLPALDAADEFLGYVCRTAFVPGVGPVPSTKEPLMLAGRIATARVAATSGRFVGDRPQAIAAYVQDVGGPWAPFLLDLQDALRTRWRYRVPEAPEDRTHFAGLCRRTLEFERAFLDGVAAGPRGPHTDAYWRSVTSSASAHRPPAP